jgi:long-subunit acyl-CoA synthetase (AMP-forming)/acyl carrier protein
VLEALPQASVLNTYGATEAADASAADEASMRGQERVPIGLPLSNMSLYVVDADLQLCPTGVEGMLCVHGASVANGYWNDPRLTAQRFLPDTFASTPGARMYWLGDRARRLHDGTIECLGRRDHQLKLRGLRIETGEIEHVIEKCPGVRAAALVAVPNNTGESVLVAHVAVDQDARVDRQRVAEHLRKHLPDYMQPNVLVVRDELPHGASGKIDREALKALGLPALEEDAHVEPRSEIEQLLAVIWKDILRLERVSVTAGFFDLGGHSLLAMRIVVRIREELGVKLSAQDLFQLLTIEQVARRLDAQLAVGRISDVSGEEGQQPLDVTEF